MTAYNGFKWPESGYVAAPDWDPSPECGRGLHGWARGEGHYVHEYNDGKWLVVDVLDADVVHLDGKCKFRAGTVVFCGTRQGAVAYLIQTGALTANSDPAWVCLTPGQAVQVAFACADRAVRVHVASALKSAGLADESAKLQSLAPIDSPSAADAARSAARAAARSAADAADAADAAAYLADSADSADSAAHSAHAARSAARSAGHAAASAASARSAADSAAYSAVYSAAYLAAYLADSAASATRSAAYSAHAATSAARWAADSADSAASAERSAEREDRLRALGLIP